MKEVRLMKKLIIGAVVVAVLAFAVPHTSLSNPSESIRVNSELIEIANPSDSVRVN
jgi:Phr family secreted Rap phosphatase inhibitor